MKPHNTIVWLACFCFAANFARADIIDQAWELPQAPFYTYGWGAMSIVNNSPIGQEFTPGADTLTAVELPLRYLGDSYGTQFAFQVEIHQANINGYVIASSNRLLPGAYEPGYAPLWRRFEFQSPVPLSVGSTYVIELSLNFPLTGAWCWDTWEDADGIGLPGQPIRDGVYGDGIVGDSARGFRTYTVPEPATATLLALGAVLIRKQRKKKGKK